MVLKTTFIDRLHILDKQYKNDEISGLIFRFRIDENLMNLDDYLDESKLIDGEETNFTLKTNLPDSTNIYNWGSVTPSESTFFCVNEEKNCKFIVNKNTHHVELYIMFEKWVDYLGVNDGTF